MSCEKLYVQFSTVIVDPVIASDHHNLSLPILSRVIVDEFSTKYLNPILVTSFVVKT